MLLVVAGDGLMLLLLMMSFNHYGEGGAVHFIHFLSHWFVCMYNTMHSS